MNFFAPMRLPAVAKRVVAAALLMLGAAWPLGAQSLVITTVAGYAGKGSNDGVGASTLFFKPQAVALDGAGNIYVADTGNNTIRVISPSGVSTTLAGTPGVAGSSDGTGSGALFNQPAGLALDGAANVYVGDYGNSTIRKVTPLGVVTTIAGAAGVTGSVNANGTNASFFHPLGLAVDSATNIYVADYGNHLIRKIAPGGLVSTLAGMAGVFGFANGTGTGAEFYQPESVAVDGSANVYVADTGNAAIRMITPGGVVSTLAGSPGNLGYTDGTGSALFYQPAAIAFAGGTTLYVVDSFYNTVRQVSTGGAVTTLAGAAGISGSADGTGNQARFANPQGVAVSGSGLVYVADTGNGTIRTMTASGVVATLAGSPSAGAANGAATSARFHGPRGIAVDAAFNIYAADTDNSVIRKITPLGVVSVFAGTPGVSGSLDGTGPAALLSGPQGLAVDGGGNVYVADTGNHTIRKISPGGVVVTFAGAAGNPGNADGAGTNAQFFAPQGVAVDSSGNLYVADTGNHTIRKLSTGGVSSTLAGLPGTPGTLDGTNGGARFNGPAGLAVDSSGNLYVADYNNHTIREVSPAGVVATLAGTPGVWGATDGTNGGSSFYNPAGLCVAASGILYVVDSGNQTLRNLTLSGGNTVVTTVAGAADVFGSSDGLGAAANFDYPTGVAADANGNLYVADSANNTIRSQAIPPSILTQPSSLVIPAGTAATFSVAAAGSSPLSYSWEYDNTAIPFASGSSLLASNAGTYFVIVSNLAGSVTSSSATLTLTNPPVVAQPGVFQTITVLTNGSVQMNLAGTTNAVYTLDFSSNLIAWTPLVTFTMSNGVAQFTDAGAATNFPARFYRLVSP